MSSAGKAYREIINEESVGKGTLRTNEDAGADAYEYEEDTINR